MTQKIDIGDKVIIIVDDLQDPFQEVEIEKILIDRNKEVFYYVSDNNTGNNRIMQFGKYFHCNYENIVEKPLTDLVFHNLKEAKDFLKEYIEELKW